MDFTKTILGLPYREDDRVLIAANFIAEHFNSPGIEIEAKIGSFKFHNSPPLITHITEIDLQSIGGRFESSLQPLMFFSLLDQLKAVCKDFTYEETEDSLYTCPGRDSKIRQTVGKNNQIIAIIKKTKLADKNFILNTSGLGIRISANFEETLAELPEDSRFSIMRKKKRFAFRYQYLEVDLTEVSMNNKITFELEVEIADYQFVKGHVDNYISGKEKGGLVGIARKIWQNVLALGFHKPKATVGRLQEDPSIMETRARAYDNVVGTVRPIIGDYLYCIAKEKENAEMVV
jgi:hypothetical protein